MNDTFPTDVTVTEGRAGVSYRLPPRPLGPYRYVGLALFLVGLILCSLPLFPAWKVVQALRDQIPPDQGLAWLFAACFLFMFLLGGVYLAQIGLLILAGHSEIELRDGTLYAVERCGPVCWKWERPAAGLRRFFVSEGLEPFNIFGTASVGPLGRLCVITPDWQPVVGVRKTKPMWLAPGYPRPWLVALANDLARRCPPAVTPDAPALAGVPVLKREPDFSDFEELAERPAGSTILVQESADGLTLIAPPLGLRHGTDAVIGGLFVGLVAFGFTTHAVQAAKVGPAAVIATLAWILAIILVLVGVNHSSSRAVLAVRGARLTVWQSNLINTQEGEWSRRQVADIFVVHHPGDADHDDRWELRIQPHPGEGAAFDLLAGRDGAELRWVATVLRRVLRCPGHREKSPPAGLVVNSPRLALRFRTWGQQR